MLADAEVHFLVCQTNDALLALPVFVSLYFPAMRNNLFLTTRGEHLQK
jgi:hypothetical protein